jgi:hypothetical protein
MEREPGFYWVKLVTWTVAQYENDWGWMLPGNDAARKDSYFDEIGPKIKPPQ